MTNIPLTVLKPARYVGNELNTVSKGPSHQSLVRFALAFPDTYEVGMSHLGLKILYNILNSRDDVWAERVYTPWIDMEEIMKKEGIFSLESSTPLQNFDIIGFSLQYEMSYTNVLNMLALARIPLLSKDRNDNHPLIIAGGPCVFNPEPIADFIDMFVIGDGEEIVTEIVDYYKTYKNLSKRQLLEKMSKIEGIYVPMLVSLEEQSDGTLVVSDGTKVRKRVVNDLDKAIYPVDYIVPFIRPIHDRAVIEIMRGCSRGCRFCQAGMIYRPVRERSSTTIIELAEKVIEKTGYEELSLSSLSTCDHTSIYGIVTELINSFKKKHVSVSLPSLRTDAFSLELAQRLGSAGKTGLTFAPEVATDRMRKVINKDISKTQVLSTVESAFSSGWDTLKLYFMIGLPTETEDDILEIASLIKEVLNVAKRNSRRAKLSVSVSTFVPKAHTPFQWERQLSIEEVQKKQRFLMDKIGRNSRISVSFHSPQLSFLEGVFARGDRRLSKLLLEAHKSGCKLDGWTEHFGFNKWMKAFAISGIDPGVYLKARAFDQVLPWDHIDTRITKEFLLAECKRSYNAEMTPDCRTGECSECGVCDKEIKVKLDVRHKTALPESDFVESNVQDTVSKIRFQFAKGSEVKFISHLDIINVFTRAFRRAEIPIAYSRGFSPHPKINFASALPVGSTSKAEFADIGLDEDIKVEDFISRVNAQLPSGVMILRAQEIPLRSESLMAQTGFASYVIRIPEFDCQAVNDLESKIQSIMSSDRIVIGRALKSKHPDKQNLDNISPIDVKPYIKSIKLSGCDDRTLQLEMVLGDGGSKKVRPEEIISLLFSELAEDGKHDHKISALDIQKTEFFIESQGRFFSPMESFRD